jgi:hypothetical protein
LALPQGAAKPSKTVGVLALFSGLALNKFLPTQMAIPLPKNRKVS